MATWSLLWACCSKRHIFSDWRQNESGAMPLYCVGTPLSIVAFIYGPVRERQPRYRQHVSQGRIRARSHVLGRKSAAHRMTMPDWSRRHQSFLGMSVPARHTRGGVCRMSVAVLEMRLPPFIAMKHADLFFFSSARGGTMRVAASDL